MKKRRKKKETGKVHPYEKKIEFSVNNFLLMRKSRISHSHRKKKKNFEKNTSKRLSIILVHSISVARGRVVVRSTTPAYSFGHNS